jgi:hypothetical protein
VSTRYYVLKVCLEERSVGVGCGWWEVGRVLGRCVRSVSWCYPEES